jgi:hypothetical protein
MYRAVVTAIPLLIGAGHAHAGAVDGSWCDTGMRHMEIDGLPITTSPGASLKGVRNRHGFKYQEPSDGKSIVMVLTPRLKAGEEPDDIWHRCAAPTS